MGNNIKRIVFLIIAILFAVLTVNFILWLLPFILIGIIAYYIYNKLTRNRVTIIKQENYKSNDKNQKKKIIIIDEKK